MHLRAVGMVFLSSLTYFGFTKMSPNEFLLRPQYYTKHFPWILFAYHPCHGTHAMWLLTSLVLGLFRHFVMYIDYKAPNGTVWEKAAGIVLAVFFWHPTLSAAEFPSGSDRLYSLKPACTTELHPQPKHFNVHMDQIPLAQMTQVVHSSETSVLT